MTLWGRGIILRGSISKFLSKINIINVIGTLLVCLLSIKTYKLIENNIFKIYWIGIPIVFVLGFRLVQTFVQKKVFALTNVLTILLSSTLVMGVVIKVNYIKILFVKYEEYLIVFTVLIILIVLLINLRSIKNEENKRLKENNKDDLFNLFYLNTSKAHEIAMLIDNKIATTIEKQKSYDSRHKSNASLGLNKILGDGTSLNYEKEITLKNSVFENFDVKNTKSTMLKKIYSSIVYKSINEKKVGNILLFKNIKLIQDNTDDTVMTLNVLKDMNMKNTNEDSIELNFSKMMSEMLDDFTIDYTFKYNENSNNYNYLIRIPYKAKENFENGYSHNDLQTGRLSIIGIYRGKVNFSNVSSISSKFLEMFSQSYNGALKQKKVGSSSGLSSSSVVESTDIPEFKVGNNKLEGNHHLIDLIAIIQEINIQGGE